MVYVRMYIPVTWCFRDRLIESRRQLMDENGRQDLLCRSGQFVAPKPGGGRGAAVEDSAQSLEREGEMVFKLLQPDDDRGTVLRQGRSTTGGFPSTVHGHLRSMLKRMREGTNVYIYVNINSKRFLIIGQILKIRKIDKLKNLTAPKIPVAW